MNTDKVNQDWTAVKGQIKSKWSKLLDGDIEHFKGHMELITAKIQNVYGMTKEKAEQEYSEFKKSLESKSDSQNKSKSH